MIIPVHQALFGEVNRGHGLLASSLPESLLRSIPQLVTDLPGSSIPPDLKWEPYIRGYKAGNYYIISKTFPDPDASRPGMVFTHVLILDLTEICQNDDLATVFHLLPEAIQKSSSVQALQVVTTELTTSHFMPPGYGKVVNTLLNNPQHTVIWVGNDGFVQIVESLWKNLWPNARQEFSFRISFAPQDLQDSPPTIVCIPEALVGRWTHKPLVRITDEYMPNPSDEMYLAEAFLMGLPEGMPVREFQRTLNAFSSDLATLRILGRSLRHLQQVKCGVQDVNLVRDLVRSLAKLSPSPNEGVNVKQMAITQLQELTGQGGASDIRAIRNIILKPYPNTSSFFTETIATWMNRRLLIESDRDPDTVAQMLESAFSESNSEWGQSVNANLATWLNNWNEKTASAVWQWWQQSPLLVQQLKKYLPDHSLVEQNLVTECPSKLSSSLAEMVITLSQEQKWFSLHAVTQLVLSSPLVAIKKHLDFDRSPTFEDAIHEIARRVDSKTLLDAALDIGENRLLGLAGRICAKESNFLSELDLNVREWRIIWYESMLVSKNPWQGIHDPLTTMNSILSRVLQQLPVENNLLEQLGETVYGDLTEHPERATIWQILPSNVSGIFQDQTAEGWLRQFSTNAHLDTALEPTLRSAIVAPERLLRHFQLNQSNLLPFTIRLFSTFTELSENQLCHYCLNSDVLPRSHIVQFDAYQLGQLIQQRKWKTAATKVNQLVQRHGINQLIDTLRECYELLSWWDQVSLHLSGSLPQFKRSDDDWWMSFAVLATELYQTGPNEQELWTRANGDKSILKISGSGRENWQDAARKLRNGGGGDRISISRVLAEMLKDFPHNRELKLLKQLFEKSNKFS